MDVHHGAGPAGGPVRTLAELIPRAARRDPAGEALVGGTDRWTWSALDHATLSLASTLRRLGVRPGDRVAVAMPKSARSVISVHGLLRTGAVMVPVDPLAPAAVAQQVLLDAGVRALVGDGTTVGRLGDDCLDGVALVLHGTGRDGAVTWDEAVGGTDPGAAPDPGVGPDDPAYLIYTSGSTGRPKGILHTNASALAYVERAAAVPGMRADDRVAGMCPLHFDMSTLELYVAPLVGATTVVMGEAELRFPATLAQRLEQERISFVYAVPFQFRQMVERGGLDRRDVSSLREIVYAGEPFPPTSLAALMAVVPQARVTNAYGPAEVNVCTVHVVDAPPTEAVPIGRPWDGARVRVVDTDGGEVPAGGVGELWVDAPTAMTGYWGRPDLTAAAFVVDDDGARWYRTGDLVVRDGEGLLHYRGRADHQVKVRGVRIELEAVEAVLASAPGVREAVVGPIGPSGDAASLVAAIVMEDDKLFDEVALRRWCGERLAAVAVPQSVALHASLPSTSSGKVDRRRVREALASGAQVEDAVTRPGRSGAVGTTGTTPAGGEGDARR